MDSRFQKSKDEVQAALGSSFGEALSANSFLEFSRFASSGEIEILFRGRPTTLPIRIALASPRGTCPRRQWASVIFPLDIIFNNFYFV